MLVRAFAHLSEKLFYSPQCLRSCATAMIGPPWFHDIPRFGMRAWQATKSRKSDDLSGAGVVPSYGEDFGVIPEPGKPRRGQAKYHPKVSIVLSLTSGSIRSNVPVP